MAHGSGPIGWLLDLVMRNDECTMLKGLSIEHWH